MKTLFLRLTYKVVCKKGWPAIGICNWNNPAPLRNSKRIYTSTESALRTERILKSEVRKSEWWREKFEVDLGHSFPHILHETPEVDALSTKYLKAKETISVYFSLQPSLLTLTSLFTLFLQALHYLQFRPVWSKLFHHERSRFIRGENKNFRSGSASSGIWSIDCID